jgi:hypothetical protein
MTMKFKINIEPFLKTIRPAVELAGKSPPRLDLKKYLTMNSELLNGYEGITCNAIRLAISKYCREMESKKKRGFTKDVCAYIRQNVYQLKLITVKVRKDEIKVSSSNGEAVITSTISEDNLVNFGYECEEEGELTVEAEHFWKTLKNLKEFNRVVVSSPCECRATVMPEADKYTSREFPKFLYHIEPVTIYDHKMITKLDPETIIDGIRKVSFALEGNKTNEISQYLIVRISKNKIRFTGGNGELFAVCEISCNKEICEEQTEIIFDRKTIESLTRTLSKIKGNEVEVSYMKNSNSKEYPWQVLFIQRETVLSVPAKKRIKKYPQLDEYLTHDYKYKVFTKPNDWQLYVGDKKFKVGIAGYPNVKIIADFVEGEFSIFHGQDCNQSTVPFRYSSNIPYIDTSSIKSDEVTIITNSEHIVKMLQTGRDDDLISIEFGVNKVSGKVKKTILQTLVVAKYPVIENRARGTKQELFLLFPRKVKDT